jgi:hypothetical protein
MTDVSLYDLRVFTDEEMASPSPIESYGDLVRITRPVTYADILAVVKQLGGEVRYRPNGDKLLVLKLEDGRPPEPILPVVIPEEERG